MKALICKEIGEIANLAIQEVPIPDISDNQILIKVAYCGLNFPDLLMIQGKYQFEPETPYSPGSEVSGVVVKVGSKVSQFKLDDRVTAFTMISGCSEYVILDTRHTFILPETVKLEIGSIASYTYGTAYHALIDRANIKSNEKILILGASGGVGSAAIEISKMMGLTVIAAASTDEKMKFCKNVGADFTINYTKENLKSQVKEQFGTVDVVLDPVGGEMSNLAIRTLGWNGRYLVVGFASGTIPKIPLNIPLLKSCQIVGVFWSKFRQDFLDQYRVNAESILRCISKEQLKPQVPRLVRLEEVPNILQKMQNRELIGKISVKLGFNGK